MLSAEETDLLRELVEQLYETEDPYPCIFATIDRPISKTEQRRIRDEIDAILSESNQADELLPVIEQPIESPVLTKFSSNGEPVFEERTETVGIGLERF